MVDEQTNLGCLSGRSALPCSFQKAGQENLYARICHLGRSGESNKTLWSRIPCPKTLEVVFVCPSTSALQYRKHVWRLFTDQPSLACMESCKGNIIPQYIYVHRVVFIVIQAAGNTATWNHEVYGGYTAARRRLYGGH